MELTPPTTNAPPVETSEARGPQPADAGTSPVADDCARAAVQDDASSGGRTSDAHDALPYPLGKVVTYDQRGHRFTALCVITHGPNGTMVALTPDELWAFARAPVRQVDVEVGWNVLCRVLTRDSAPVKSHWFQALTLEAQKASPPQVDPG